MFSIIISEKGGAERKESFDKNEINVGRVQGNDLVLPKGNVSKHHARLLFRDGRFIVTDLKSTNGTYVNGRKIAQATIVREGDKVYVGDFVLRLDSAAGSAAIQDAADDPVHDAATMGSAQGPAGNLQQPAPPPVPLVSPLAQQAALTAVPGQGGPPRPKLPGPSISMPDEGSPPAQIAPLISPLGGGGASGLPDAPKRPSLLPRASTMPMDQKPPRASQAPPAERSPAPPPLAIGLSSLTGAGTSTSASAPPPALAPEPRPPTPGPVARPSLAGAPPPLPPPAPAAPVATPARPPSRDTSAPAGRALALLALMNRVGQAMDLGQIGVRLDGNQSQSLERLVREQASSMRGAGEVPDGVDLDALVGDAMAELVAVGPLNHLLDDEEISEIHCLRHDQLLVVRQGAWRVADTSFTSDHAAGRALARLLDQSGGLPVAGEVALERRLARGALLSVVFPPASTNYVFVIKKRQVVDRNLDDLVRAGAMSRAMGTFLEACVAGHVSLLVSGPTSLAAEEIVAGLVSLATPGERIALVQETTEVHAPQAHTVSVHASVAGLHAVARLRTDRLVVTRLANGVAAALVDVIADGQPGVIAATLGSSLRQSLARFSTQIVFARPGLAEGAAREALAESFDIAIEVATTADRRVRIARIAELSGVDAKGIVVRDIFTSVGEGAADGGFTATGIVPRIATELAQRGIRFDSSLFKRGGR